MVRREGSAEEMQKMKWNGMGEGVPHTGLEFYFTFGLHLTPLSPASS